MRASVNTRAMSRAGEEVGERLDDAWLPYEVKERIAELEGDPNGFTSICHDCGIDAWAFEEDGRTVTEEFYVSSTLWDAAAPDDEVIHWTTEDGAELGQGRFVLCLGCVERRLGRTLTKDDLGAKGRPPRGASRRYRERWTAAVSHPVEVPRD